MTRQDPKFFQDLPYEVIVEEDEYTTEGMKCYRAFSPQLPGCVSHGDTPEEAKADWEDAKLLYIETLIANGQQVPLPNLPTTLLTTLGKVEITEALQYRQPDQADDKDQPNFSSTLSFA